MEKRGNCLNCAEVIEGRVDRKFCSGYCKSNYHYRLNKGKESSFFIKVEKQLKLNRRILKDYNKAGKATVRVNVLLELGFDPHFFTHYWKNRKGNVYLFVFEFGFLKREENGKLKYVLVKWQDYMES
tara:strand:- start:68 stop:448 length:381 start_codon:yes stop_codon:yes gene_type:complete